MLPFPMDSKGKVLECAVDQSLVPRLAHVSLIL
jgi:hypothetical protein